MGLYITSTVCALDPLAEYGMDVKVEETEGENAELWDTLISESSDDIEMDCEIEPQATQLLKPPRRSVLNWDGEQFDLSSFLKTIII